MAARFPVRSQQFDANVAGVPTAFLLSAYSDRVMIVATQLGTLGTVMHARCVLAPCALLPAPLHS
jgi:proteasome assembly chaperone 3